MNISSASISLMQSQVLSSMMNSTFGAKRDDSWATMFSLLIPNSAATSPLASDPLSLLTQGSNAFLGDSIKGLSLTGRNMALADPESAYKMMTVINSKDVYYKAQFSELSQMKSYVFQMQDAGCRPGLEWYCVIYQQRQHKIPIAGVCGAVQQLGSAV